MLLLQIISSLQELSITKAVFQSQVERGHGNEKGGVAGNSNGYSTNQSSMMVYTERIANGYYKTVVC